MKTIIAKSDYKNNIHHMVTERHSSRLVHRSPIIRAAGYDQRSDNEPVDELDDHDDGLDAASVQPAQSRHDRKSSASSKRNIPSRASTEGNTQDAKAKTAKREPSALAAAARRMSARGVSKAVKPQTSRSTMPIVTAIDKLNLCGKLTQSEMGGAINRAKGMVSDKRLTRGTRKGSFYRHVFVLHVLSGTTVTFCFDPTKATMKWQMMLTLNPRTLTADDCSLLKSTFKTIFAFDALGIAKSLHIKRLDECADFPCPIEHLLIVRQHSKIESKYFVATGTDSTIQTWYGGSKYSPEHGCAYDKTAQDPNYREWLKKKLTAEDADLSLQLNKGITRIENRRKFTKAITLAEFQNLDDPFGIYRVYDISRFAGKKLDVDFLTYVDCVRLRGLNGARLFLAAKSAGTKKETDNKIAEMEKKLSKAAVDWWPPAAHNSAQMEWLKASPLWSFLNVMK